MNPDQIGGRRVLSPMHHHCPHQQITDEESRSNQCCTLKGLGVLIFCSWVVTRSLQVFAENAYDGRPGFPCFRTLLTTKHPPVCLEHGFENSLVHDRLMTGRTAKFHLLLISLITTPHWRSLLTTNLGWTAIQNHVYGKQKTSICTATPWTGFVLHVVHYSLYLPGNR